MSRPEELHPRYLWYCRKTSTVTFLELSHRLGTEESVLVTSLTALTAISAGNAFSSIDCDLHFKKHPQKTDHCSKVVQLREGKRLKLMVYVQCLISVQP